MDWIWLNIFKSPIVSQSNKLLSVGLGVRYHIDLIIWVKKCESLKATVICPKSKLWQSIGFSSTEYLPTNPSYERHWISWRLRFVPRIKKKLLTGVTSQVPHVMCHGSRLTCHMSPVICHMSLMPTATATDPPHTNSSSMHSRMLLLIVT